MTEPTTSGSITNHMFFFWEAFITGIADASRRCLEQAVLTNLSSSLEPLYLRGAKFKINASRD